MTFEDGCYELVSSGMDLSVRQLAVLHRVARNPGLSVRDIALALQVSKPAITRATDRLTADGLADRVGSTEDRRTVCITATTKGVQLLARVGTVLS